MDKVAEAPLAPVSTGGAVPERRPDFDRAVVPILGLPFDAITVDQAVQHIRSAAIAGRRCLVSTPNLNFAIAARKDQAFRDSILRSDLSLVDGMPLVWIARWLGLPVPERVSGADVFEALQAHEDPPLHIYLFGAPPGAAAAACERINARAGGLRCVGHDAGGFGSIESLSTDEHIARINRSGAHFVVVALGAAKGQAWIERNASRLHAPVLSHLGAVVNFAAGSLARAPRWMRRAGLEWAWRVKEEPGLWRRYASDGLKLGSLLVDHVIPDRFAVRIGPKPTTTPTGVAVSTTDDATTIALRGSWRGDVTAVRRALAECAEGENRVVFDLRGVSDVGAPFVALLMLANGWFRGRAGMTVVGVSQAVLCEFRRKMADHVL